MATIHIYNQIESNGIANALERVCNPVAHALAYRLRQCAENKNLFTGKNMFPARTGGKADGAGSLWCCNSKLCPFCVSKSARKNRKLAEYVFENLPENRRRFIVLTMPDKLLRGCSLDEQTKIINYAYREMYRHSDYYKQAVKGAIKTTEFTIDNRRSNPFHVHLNLLTDSPFISYTKLKSEWSKALQIAFNHFGIVWNNAEAIIYLKQIVKREVKKENELKEINHKNVVFEITKYITKPQAWNKVPVLELAEAVENKKFFRFFEVTGSCRKIARAVRYQSVRKKTAKLLQLAFTFLSSHSASVHIKNLFVLNLLLKFANPPNAPPKKRKLSWVTRIKHRLTSLQDYKTEIESEFIKAKDFRTRQLRSKYYWVTDWQTANGKPF